MTSAHIRLTDDMVLRPVEIADAAAVARAYVRNVELLAPWEPIRPADYFTEAGQASRLKQFDEARRDGRVERWVFDHGDGEVHGSVTLSGIELGVFLNARIGYWMDQALNGRGLMTAAVSAICDHARERWNLHRVEASTGVGNVASQRVLAKCGFEEIGLSPKHLYINGAWMDSKLFHRILHTDPLEP